MNSDPRQHEIENAQGYFAVQTRGMEQWDELREALAERVTGGDDRIRTGDEGFADPCLTTWRRRLKKKVSCRIPAVRIG